MPTHGQIDFSDCAGHCFADDGIGDAEDDVGFAVGGAPALYFMSAGNNDVVEHVRDVPAWVGYVLGGGTYQADAGDEGQ